MQIRYDQSMTGNENLKVLLRKLEHYVYAFVEIDAENKSDTIFYVGEGKGLRCLDHIKANPPNRELARKISACIDRGVLRIDIIRHGLESKRQAQVLEAACIDLMNINQLTNKVRGSGVNFGRMALHELMYIHKLSDKITVPYEHRGIAFLLNKTYRSGMSDLELFENTRGVWRNPPIKNEPKYAYATYHGVVREVYEISAWVPAGTQQYFTRNQEQMSSKLARMEFVGRKAQESVRQRYVGKVINKQRSYAPPFVLVGY